ncbi:TetR/AcrR family transcriptional regulator [Flavobacterium sp. DG1-102-2]|uniref:TetR/AcrR family transcriptional regulator n=1 Tax=Flavobacterium sp. DG1-102-2 TaxID=3081663 RepID=UPI002948CB0C|nr:TetR/AcrR family transcriptional regulator [Flavobacterium sp. DG1-102-2]MDV6167460.1 TetR/AcrR family transcriptional regulator [Flavobacterium sp. DG1-102-2]
MKETILQKATDMFLTLGYKSVTMDDIANEMGISKKTIYLHYANKNELVEASTTSLFITIAEGIDEICTLGYNSIEEIFIIRKFLMKHLNNETASPFFQLQKFFPQTFSALRQKQFEKMHTCMTESIEKGIRDGLYRTDLDVDFTSRIYFTGLTGIKDSDIFPHSVYDINAVTRQFLEYHLRAITTESGQSQLKEVLKKY